MRAKISEQDNAYLDPSGYSVKNVRCFYFSRKLGINPIDYLIARYTLLVLLVLLLSK